VVSTPPRAKRQSQLRANEPAKGAPQSSQTKPVDQMVGPTNDLPTTDPTKGAPKTSEIKPADQVGVPANELAKGGIQNHGTNAANKEAVPGNDDLAVTVMTMAVTKYHGMLPTEKVPALDNNSQAIEIPMGRPIDNGSEQDNIVRATDSNLPVNEKQKETPKDSGANSADKALVLNNDFLMNEK
jgi:hypothetical protein